MLGLFASFVGGNPVPNVERLLARTRFARLRIIGARGALNYRHSREVLTRAGIAEGEFTRLERHLAIEQEIADAPLVAGNRTRILRDGAETFRAVFAAIRGARQHVNLEYYIFEEIESDGVRLSELLIEKVRAGVAVNVIYDSVGSIGTADAFLAKLQAAGVALLAFNPLNPLKARNGYRLNARDHRKILVADGRLAIIGGINLSSTYLSSSPVRTRNDAATATENPDAKQAEYWRDLDLEIEGPVVAQLQRLFVDHWSIQQGPSLNVHDFFPKLEPAGPEIVRVIGSSPEEQVPRYYATLLSAIRNADRNIFVAAAYFVPTRAHRRSLIKAARRGVDVRLLLPGKSDSKIAIAAQRSRYGSLFRAGVQIYEVEDCILHSKMVTVDGVWTVIGSSNLDHRSVIYNDEVDAVILGKETAGAMERLYAEDLAEAVAVDPAQWRRRPWTARMWEALARLCEHLL